MNNVVDRKELDLIPYMRRLHALAGAALWTADLTPTAREGLMEPMNTLLTQADKSAGMNRQRAVLMARHVRALRRDLSTLRDLKFQGAPHLGAQRERLLGEARAHLAEVERQMREAPAPAPRPPGEVLSAHSPAPLTVFEGLRRAATHAVQEIGEATTLAAALVASKAATEAAWSARRHRAALMLQTATGPVMLPDKGVAVIPSAPMNGEARYLCHDIYRTRYQHEAAARNFLANHL